MAQNRRYNQKPPIEQVIVESFFKGLYNLIMLLFKRGKKVGISDLKRQELEQHWVTVERLAANSPTVAQAISEGDKLVDYAMQVRGISGSTMGERLKNSQSVFSPAVYQKLWDAHKLRNRLAHDVGASASEREAKEAIATFRQALDNLYL